MASIFTKTWLVDAAERAVKSAAQAVVLGFGFSNSTPVDAFDYDWKLASGFALGGAVLSLLTSIISAPIGDNGTASMVPSPPGPEAPPQPLPPPGGD